MRQDGVMPVVWLFTFQPGFTGICEAFAKVLALLRLLKR
jgi:hypothetical protein